MDKKRTKSFKLYFISLAISDRGNLLALCFLGAGATTKQKKRRWRCGLAAREIGIIATNLSKTTRCRPRAIIPAYKAPSKPFFSSQTWPSKGAVVRFMQMKQNVPPMPERSVLTKLAAPEWLVSRRQETSPDTRCVDTAIRDLLEQQRDRKFTAINYQPTN